MTIGSIVFEITAQLFFTESLIIVNRVFVNEIGKNFKMSKFLQIHFICVWIEVRFIHSHISKSYHIEVRQNRRKKILNDNKICINRLRQAHSLYKR